ncbi:MAG: class I SAM-dependent RNA methyltransferase [Alphaproteobacteria bacterium]|nr:class I SAM-dependent RNA methyltransferase [Alphaproteobacteria bacterium]
MDAAAYTSWKRGFVEAALRRAGVMAEVAEPVQVPPASRRRARFFVEQGASSLKLGFQGRRSHDVVDMTTCLVLEPVLFALTRPLRAYFAETLGAGDRAEAEVQLVDGALDVLIREPATLDMEKREKLARFAAEAGIARLFWEGLDTRVTGPRRGPRVRARRATAPAEPEIIVERTPIAACFGGINVPLPPLAFIQASTRGEAILRDAVAAAVPGGARVADLFSGAGTFTFPLATFPLAGGRRVTAFDGDGELIDALNAAARAAGLGATVTGQRRNLVRRPLSIRELDHFDAVVLDPPRAGALTQVRELAASKVPRVVMVSCNPESFARDAKALIDGGYDLGPGPVLPVDQFVWTRHLELVASFSRF